MDTIKKKRGPIGTDDFFEDAKVALLQKIIEDMERTEAAFRKSTRRMYIQFAVGAVALVSVALGSLYVCEKIEDRESVKSNIQLLNSEYRQDRPLLPTPAPYVGKPFTK